MYSFIWSTFKFGSTGTSGIEGHWGLKGHLQIIDNILFCDICLRRLWCGNKTWYNYLSICWISSSCERNSNIYRKKQLFWMNISFVQLSIVSDSSEITYINQLKEWRLTHFPTSIAKSLLSRVTQFQKIEVIARFWGALLIRQRCPFNQKAGKNTTFTSSVVN